MRFCIYGAGATGGVLGARLGAAGHEVSLIARGAHLAALRANGLRIIAGDDELLSQPLCTDDPAEAGAQDCVFVTAKAHGVPDVAARIAPLLGPDTPIVFTQNGIPWWYFHGVGGGHDGCRLRSIDPDGRIAEMIDPARVIGGVIAMACRVVEPGVVRHGAGDTLILGEPDGAMSERCRRLSATLEAAGFTAPVAPAIRDEIWAKLWGNVSFSQLAVLTGAGLTTLAGDPQTEALARTIMAETQSVAEALGASLPMTIDQRIAQTMRMGNHKTSILQDLEAGRPMEVDALVGSVIELGRLAGVATPVTELIYTLVRRRAIEAGCYPGDIESIPFDAG